MSYEVLQALWPAIECPVLHVVGAESDIGKAMTDEDVTLFRHATRVVIPDAGHWVHHDQLDAFIREARAFLAAVPERNTEAAG
jgi:pimeloyl-ACP methyl ester carboxylesterase